MNLFLNTFVLYSKNLEDMRDFYGLLGFNFTTEQHADGPIHYSCQVGEGSNIPVMELYPVPPRDIDVAGNLERKLNTKPYRLEFVSDSIESIRSKLLTKVWADNIIDSDQKTGLKLVDPDGNIVILQPIKQ